MITPSGSAPRFALNVALALVCLTGSAGAEQQPATEEQAAQCIEGFEQSQVLRQSGKLRAARLELLKCAQLHCRQALQVPCTRWLEEVETATPTVIIEARVNGEDSTDVRVEMDGEVLTEQLTGKALELDPGPHQFRFAHRDFPPVDKKYLIREGDKRRVLEVAFESARESAPAKSAEPDVSSAPPEQSAPPQEMYRPVPVVTYVLAGIAVAGLGTSAVLGLTAKNREDELKNSCSPDCSDDDVEDLQSRYRNTNIVLGVSAAVGIAAVVTFLARPDVPKDDAKFSAGFGVVPGAASAYARLKF